MKDSIHTTINKEVLKEIKKQCIDEDINLNDLIEKMWRVYKIFLESGKSSST